MGKVNNMECMLKDCNGIVVKNDNTHLMDGYTCNKCNAFYPEGQRVIYIGDNKK